MLAAYQVLFDITKAEPPNLAHPVTAGVIVLIVSAISFWANRRMWRASTLVVTCLIALLGLGLVAFPLLFRVRLERFARAVREGRCRIVEGVVEQFQPMPSSGHGTESFEVAGRRFVYSEHAVDRGFHQTQLSNGPIRNGLRVRICYIGNDIGLLEAEVPQ